MQMKTECYISGARAKMDTDCHTSLTSASSIIPRCVAVAVAVVMDPWAMVVVDVVVVVAVVAIAIAVIEPATET